MHDVFCDAFSDLISEHKLSVHYLSRPMLARSICIVLGHLLSYRTVETLQCTTPSALLYMLHRDAMRAIVGIGSLAFVAIIIAIDCAST